MFTLLEQKKLKKQIKKELKSIYAIDLSDHNKFFFDEKNNCYDLGKFNVLYGHVQVAVEYTPRLGVRIVTNFNMPKQKKYWYSDCIWLNDYKDVPNNIVEKIIFAHIYKACAEHNRFN